jgi:RNA polymerase subunit RPABC4/transcription elongation factor Spt4
MGLINCYNYGHQVHEDAKKCPACKVKVLHRLNCDGCGYEIRKIAKSCPSYGIKWSFSRHWLLLLIAGNLWFISIYFAVEFLADILEATLADISRDLHIRLLIYRVVYIPTKIYILITITLVLTNIRHVTWYTKKN